MADPKVWTGFDDITTAYTDFADLPDTARMAVTIGNNQYRFTKLQLKTYIEARAAALAAAGYQPLSSDLTAIAALTTTSFGRAFLALADEAAFKAAVNLEIGTDVQAQDALLQTIADAVSFDAAGLLDKTTVQTATGTKRFSIVNTEALAGGVSAAKPAEIYNLYCDLAGYGNRGLETIVPASFCKLMHHTLRGGSVSSSVAPIGGSSLPQLFNGKGDIVQFSSPVTVTITPPSAISFARAFTIWFGANNYATEFTVNFKNSGGVTLSSHSVTGHVGAVYRLLTGPAQYNTATIEIIFSTLNAAALWVVAISWSNYTEDLFPHNISRRGGLVHGDLSFQQGATSKIRTAEAQSLVLGTNSTDRLTIDSSGLVTISQSLGIGPYTIGTLPAAASHTSKGVIVTNEATYGRCLVISDGTNWRVSGQNSIAA